MSTQPRHPAGTPKGGQWKSAEDFQLEAIRKLEEGDYFAFKQIVDNHLNKDRALQVNDDFIKTYINAKYENRDKEFNALLREKQNKLQLPYYSPEYDEAEEIVSKFAKLSDIIDYCDEAYRFTHDHVKTKALDDIARLKTNPQEAKNSPDNLLKHGTDEEKAIANALVKRGEAVPLGETVLNSFDERIADSRRNHNNQIIHISAIDTDASWSVYVEDYGEDDYSDFYDRSIEAGIEARAIYSDGSHRKVRYSGTVEEVLKENKQL